MTLRRTALGLASALLICATFAAEGFASPAGWNDALQSLEHLSRTGVIYDRVLPLAHLERLDGGAAAPVVDLATWRQAYYELRQASLHPTTPDLATLDRAARVAERSGVIPLAVFDRAFERVRPEALSDGSLRIEGGRLESAMGTPFVESRAVAAAALVPHTYRGHDVTFELDRERVFSDAPPQRIEIDFADGRGPRSVSLGERVSVHYAEAGPRTLRMGLERADGTTADASFSFDVVTLAAPAPNDTLHVTAAIPYQGQLGTGDAYVYLAPGHSQVTAPIVVIEGFDTDNSMNWDELYAQLNGENLIETLRAEGFDAVVLNFTDATVAIEQNAFVVAELIQEVQALIAPQTTIALVGASMGGLCSRYALAYMETHAMSHRVRTWISFDGPHAGADIPLGLQYWISFFAGQSADAASFLATLQRPAAREMLIYHLTSPPGTTGQHDAARDTMEANFATVGGYPTQPRLVAIANGSGAGVNQGFAPADQLIRYEYSSAFVAITGNVWAVPDQSSAIIFKGSTRIFISTTSQTVTVNSTRPWDGAPGGSRASMTQLDTTAAPYGDIVALHPSHCFIPTISSLALATPDPFFDVSGAANLLSLTPFDAVYYPTSNQEHVLITSENAAWLRSEIEQGVLAAGTSGVTALGPTLSAAPNPFRESEAITFALPRAGDVDLRVFDAQGREVRRLLRGSRAAGRHSVAWDGRDSAGGRARVGVYFVRLVADGQTRVATAIRIV